MMCLDGCTHRVPSFLPRLGRLVMIALNELLKMPNASVVFILDVRRIMRGT